MKKAMSGFDLRAMARELDALKGAYVKKAYMPHYEQIVLRVNPKEAAVSYTHLTLPTKCWV